MYNAERGEYSFNLAGRDVVLRPTHDSWQKIKALTGVGEIKLLANLEDAELPWGVTDIVAIIWAGRNGAGEKVSLQECHDQCIQHGVIGLHKICHEYLSRALLGGKTFSEMSSEKKE